MARRKGPLILIVCGLLALGAVAGVIVYRAALLQTGFAYVLRARGVPAATLTVEDVGWSTTTLGDIALGAGREVRVRRVRLAYDPADLISGQLKSVEIDGAVVSLDLTASAPMFGSLQPLLGRAPSGGGERGGAGGAREAAALPVPAIRLTDVKIEAKTPIGPATVALAGALNPTDDHGLKLALDARLDTDHGWTQARLDAARTAEGRLTGTVNLADGVLTLPGADINGLRGDAEFTAQGNAIETATAKLVLGAVSLPGVAFDQAHLDLRLTETQLDMDTELSTADGQLGLSAKARAQDLAGQPKLSVDAHAKATAQAALWAALGVPAPTAGRADATLSLQAELPQRSDLSNANLAKVESDLMQTVKGDLKVSLDAISYSGLVQDLTGQVRADLAPDAAKPNALTGEVALALKAAEASVADAHAKGVALTQRANIKGDLAGAELTATAPGRLSAKHLVYSDLLASEAPISAAIDALDATVSRKGPAITHTMTLVPDEIRVRVPGAAKNGVQIRTKVKQLVASGTYSADRPYEGTVKIGDATVAVPSHEVAVDGLTASLAVAAGRLKEVDFAAKALRHTAKSPLIAPLTVKGNARFRDKDVAFQADADGPMGVGHVAAKGRYRPATQAGDFDLTVTPLEFATGGAQPSALFPALADLRDVTGTARAGAHVAWKGKKIDGSANLAVENVNLTSPAARVEGLSLDLRLDRLQPPGSPPGQTLHVARLDPGIPLTDLSVDFQVLPRKTPAVGVSTADVSVAGGRFTMADVVVDPAAKQLHLPIQADGLDLAEAFKLLGVEGLSGEGHLSGTIPVRIQDGTPSIQGGALSATGPGVIRVRSEYAKSALAGAGESADLMLRALEDFHYDELKITIDQPAADLARLGISMLGKNPAVLEGYPFRFNINVETDPRKLLDALSEAYRISDRAIRNLWMLGR